VRKIAGIILATLLTILTLVGGGFYSFKGLYLLLTMYILYIAYEVMDFHRIVSAFRPFVVAFSFYLALKVVAMNVPDLAIYISPVEPFILPFLLSIALIKLELPTKFQPIITTIGLILTAYFGYRLISMLPLKVSGEIGVIFVILLALLALTTLLPSIHERFDFLREVRSFLITIVLVVSVYYVLVRPMLTGRPGLINIIDWAIVLGVLLKAGSIVRNSMVVDESEVVKLHEYRVSVKREEIVERIERAKRDFVERGIKSPLIVVLVQILTSAGWRAEDIARVVSYLITHRDRRIPKLSFGWERRMIEMKNRKMREKVLEDLKRYLEGMGVGLGRV